MVSLLVRFFVIVVIFFRKWLFLVFNLLQILSPSTQGFMGFKGLKSNMEADIVWWSLIKSKTNNRSI